MARGLKAAALAALLLVGACTADPGPAPKPALQGAARLGAEYRAGYSGPVADPLYPAHGNPSIDVLHYGLDLDWAPTTKTLTGTAELTLRAVRPLAEISLDFAAGLRVSEASIDGVAATPARKGDKLVLTARPIDAGAEATVVVRYSGVPKQVPMPSNRGDAKEGLGLRPTADGGAWTMQEPWGAFTWYPCSDHPSDEALYEIRLRTAPGWAGVASGSYVGELDGRTVFRSTVPVATYVTTLAFGKYTRTALTGPHGLPVSLWTRPEDKALLPVLRKTPKLIAWLESRFGPYPLAGAGAVTVPSDSAMETQELVTLGAEVAQGLPVQRRDGLVEEVMLHELAHQWFGDAVTPADWRGVWLNEGWAMYAEGQYEIATGAYTAQQWVQLMRRIDARSRARSGPPGHYDPKHFADSNVYVGPALMLHEIRAKVGDAAFFAMAKDWVRTYRNTSQDRASFTEFVQAHTGKDVRPVIDRWLDSPTTPI